MNESSLIGSLGLQARLQPQGVLFTSGAQSITFAGMEQRVNRLANALRSLDISLGNRVAILSKSQVDCAALVLAAMKIGAVCVPVNWRFGVDEIRFALDDSGARVIITDREFSARVAEAAGHGGARIFLTDEAAHEPARLDLWCAGFDERVPPRDILETDDAVHLYSSGTTGRPKGVVLTHHGLMSACDVVSKAWQLGRESVLGHALPTFHIAGILQMLFPLYVGCRCVAFRDFQPEAFLRALSEEKITHVLLVPAMIGFLLAHPASRALDFGSLRLMAYAGSPITEPVLQAAMEIFGCDFSQIYGLTEATGVVTNLTPEDHRRGAEMLRSAGKALPRTELRIVDPVSLADLEDGRVGEVWIRCDRNFKTYWQKPEATQEAFPQGRDAEGGWFRSGDAGYLQDGYLFLSDRIKDMIVSGGENVYPAEVENTLMKHPDVADGAIIGVPDPKWGEAVKACVVLRTGATATADDLIEFMRMRIAHFKCPKTVDFVTALPRTESGKLLKRELRAPYWAGQSRSIN